MALDPTVIALIGTVMGGVGLKVAEHWLGRNKVRVDDAARLRDELRLEITAQRAEIKSLEDEVDKWKMDYYELKGLYMNLEVDLKFALQKIKDEATAAETITNQLSSPHTPPNLP